MHHIPFTKAHGAKNDFVIVDDRAGAYDSDTRRQFATASAHRRTGIGSDGTIFIESSETLDFRMAFYNPDGSVGSMCGNGGRCAALFAFVRGIAPAEMRFDVLGRSYAARVFTGRAPQGLDSPLPGPDPLLAAPHANAAAQVRLSFPPPMEIRYGLAIETEHGVINADYIDNGAPHLLVFARDLPEALHAPFADLDVERIGSLLRRHERFAPRGCNVNLIEQAADGSVSIRTFEKGVEAETWACGTGTLAAGMVAHHRFGISPPIRLRTHGGDMLTVDFTPDTSTPQDTPEYFTHALALEGPAVLVFEGEFRLSPPTIASAT